MLKVPDITFFELMTAGFISADTYNILKPKKKLNEIDPVYCQDLPSAACKELEKVFYDTETSKKVSLLDSIKKDLNSNEIFIMNILEEVIFDCSYNIGNIIYRIGKKNFILNYVFCSEDILGELFGISFENLEEIKKIRNRFSILYEANKTSANDYSAYVEDQRDSFYTKFFEDRKEYSTRLEEPFGGKDFNEETLDESKNHVNIDTDCCKNNEDKKYVLFLANLEDNKFKEIDDMLFKHLSTISVRAKNAIKFIGSRNFYVNYLFADQDKMLNLRNFGRKSIKEVNKFSKVLRNKVKDIYEVSDTKSVEEEIEKEIILRTEDNTSLREKLGEVKYTKIKGELQELLSSASVRVQNSINGYPFDFIEDFVYRNADIRKLRNVGKKSEIEILSIVNKLKYKITMIANIEYTEDDIIIEGKKSLYGDLFDSYSKHIFDAEMHIPMFYILENYLKNELCNRALRILNLYSPLFKGEDSNNLEFIAENANITKERARQICVKCNEQLHELDKTDISLPQMNYSKLLSQKDDWNYVIEKVKKYQTIELKDIPFILGSELCNLTDNFILLVISIVCSDEFVLIGKDPLPVPSRNKAFWNNSYLIKKNLSESFNFDEMISIISDYENNNSEGIDLTIQEMLIDFLFLAWKNFETDKVEDLAEIVSKILIQELGIIPDYDFKFHIEGKKLEDVGDIIYDILKNNGNPLSLDDIYENVNERYPNRYKSPNSIKALVYKDPRVCYVGVNNLLGLIEWNHIKIGSIRDVIVQFLDSFNEPQHLSKIVEHVQKHRDTTEHSIRSTMGSGNQFVLFSGAYYGLKDKIYPDDFYISESEKWFNQRMQDLEIFVKTNYHFPFCPSNNQEEESLYRWWNKTKKCDTLNNIQKEKVKNFIQKYRLIPSTKAAFSWFDMCNKYNSFVQKNERRPSKYSYDESDLFRWFAKATDDFADGELDEGQEKAFLELCKSL